MVVGGRDRGVPCASSDTDCRSLADKQLRGSLAACLWMDMAYGAEGTDTLDISGSQIPGDSTRTVKSTDPGI